MDWRYCIEQRVYCGCCLEQRVDWRYCMDQSVYWGDYTSMDQSVKMII
jgi:hypothetical protein